MAGSSNAPKYVYGVVRASPKGRLKSKGINGEPIRIISSQGLGALTSDVSGEPVEWLGEAAAFFRGVQRGDERCVG